MTREEYIRAILRKTTFDGKTKKRLEADLAGSIDSRLEAGMDMAAVMAEMGSPEAVSQSLAQSMPGEVAVPKSRWRWVFLAFSILMVAAMLFSLIWYWAVIAQGDFLPAEAASVGVIGGADGPTTIYVTQSWRVGIPGTSAIGLALGSLGVFLLMQWKGVASPRRFTLLGVVLLAYAAFLLVGGLSNSMIESMLPFHNLYTIMGSRLLNPAFLAPLLAGIFSLRRAARVRRQA